MFIIIFITLLFGIVTSLLFHFLYYNTSIKKIKKKLSHFGPSTIYLRFTVERGTTTFQQDNNSNNNNNNNNNMASMVTFEKFFENIPKSKFDEWVSTLNLGALSHSKAPAGTGGVKLDKLMGMGTVGEIPIYLLPLIYPNRVDVELLTAVNTRCATTPSSEADSYMTEIIGREIANNLVEVANGTSDIIEKPASIGDKVWKKLTAFVGQLTKVEMEFVPSTVWLLTFMWFNSVSRGNSGSFIEEECQKHYPDSLQGDCFVVSSDATDEDVIALVADLSAAQRAKNATKAPSKKQKKKNPELVKAYEEVLNNLKTASEKMTTEGIRAREFDMVKIASDGTVEAIAEAKATCKTAATATKQIGKTELPSDTRIFMQVGDGWDSFRITDETKRIVFTGIDQTREWSEVPSVLPTQAIAKGSFHLSTMLQFYAAVARSGNVAPWNAFMELVFIEEPKTVSEYLEGAFAEFDEMVVCQHKDCDRETVVVHEPFTSFVEFKAALGEMM
jgi:hypothetical protein